MPTHSIKLSIASHDVSYGDEIIHFKGRDNCDFPFRMKCSPVPSPSQANLEEDSSDTYSDDQFITSGIASINLTDPQQSYLTPHSKISSSPQLNGHEKGPVTLGRSRKSWKKKRTTTFVPSVYQCENDTSDLVNMDDNDSNGADGGVALELSDLELARIIGSNIDVLVDKFDIQDVSRPSLKFRGKPSLKGLLAELSDVELAEKLEKSWNNDRRRKHMKKIERKQARQSIIVSLDRQADIKSNGKLSYSELRQCFLDALIQFLQTSESRFNFPPTPKYQRVLIHRIALKFGLKVKSHKKEPNRYCEVIKTRQILSMSKKTLQKLIEKTLIDYGKANDSNNTQGKVTLRSIRVPNFRHGDIVGAGAPEIGADNRGHVLLSKMGWTQGMALGSNDNPGSLHPVEHVIRKSRYGLGGDPLIRI